MHQDQVAAAAQPPLSQATGDASKDAFFAEVEAVAKRMIEEHGKDFAMGVLIIAAKFIADGKPFKQPASSVR